jgi:hypothetical protein
LRGRCSAAQRAHLLARAALIIACMGIAVAILGMFVPIGWSVPKVLCNDQ